MSAQKVAIVTGAARGIGAEVARRLARDGFAVVVNYASSAAAADTLVREIRAAGGTALAVGADVTVVAEVKALFDRAEHEFGGVDVLVNNAGVMDLAPIAETDESIFDQTVAVNLKGTFNTLREAANRIREGGRIVNTSSSITGRLPPTYGVYAATKAAVETLTRILSKEMRGRKVTVNAVAPGPVATELFLKGKSQQLVDNIAKLSPMERLGEPGDIASAVAMLVGPDSSWINGQTVFVDGGIY